METVGALMSREVETVEPGRPLADAVRVMAERVISCVLVVEGAKAVGIVSERDIVRRVVAAGRHATGLRVADVMTKPVFTASPETTTIEALQLLRGRGFRRLPVVDADGKLIGIATQTDLLRGVLAYFQRSGLRDILERLAQIEARQSQQDGALSTIASRHRLLDLRCTDLLRNLQRVIRDAKGPVSDMHAMTEQLAEAARALEAALGLRRDDDPAVRESVRAAETTVRHVSAENRSSLADLSGQLHRADQLLTSVLIETGARQRDGSPARGNGRANGAVAR